MIKAYGVASDMAVRREAALFRGQQITDPETIVALQKKINALAQAISSAAPKRRLRGV